MLLAAAVPAVAQQAGAPPARDLVLSNWEAARWALYPGMTIQHNVGKTPAGEALTRITLAPGDTDQNALTQVNLPVGATDRNLTCFLHKPAVSAGRHVALFQEMEHGWAAGGNTQWAVNDDTTYSTRVLNPHDGWDWKVGFFRATVGPPPYRFRGFQFHGRSDKDRNGQPVTVEAGPIHVAYVPDDAHWLYTDLQPKTIPSSNGVLPPLTLRIANLGTKPRTFHLLARPVARSGMAVSVAAVPVGAVTLQPGQLREIPIRLPLALLGRYVVRYGAEGADGKTQAEEAVSVVNAFDVAPGFRAWAARRAWFTAPSRRPGAKDDAKKGRVTIGAASNNLSLVPLFPVQARGARPDVAPSGVLAAQAKSPLTVLNTQLSPAWLIGSRDTQLTLFGDTRRQGLGGPSHLAFATAAGVRVLKPGDHLDAAALKGMTRPWLLAWWQGSDGWTQWDVPYLVTLQHRPMSLDITPQGVRLAFPKAAGYVTTMPLFGYAKLPQQAAWQQHPESYREPMDWPAAQWQTWAWDGGLPAVVTARCDWWARALTRFPYAVHETYIIDHQSGSVDVRDAYDYMPFEDDWHTVPLVTAPLSPSLAVAKLGGFPITVSGTLTDCACPTLFGPYTVVAGARALRYRLNVGPYWMKTADPNLTQPADGSTPARQAQAALLARAFGSSGDAQNQIWNWNDGNFVWDAQTSSDREPSLLNGYAEGGLRQDSKGWLQARVQNTLLAPANYSLDERSGIRRFINGPGIGDFGSGDWGDAGKLGTDMIYDAWAYAYNTGDYQTVADKWDVICSLNTLPVSQAWAAQGRAAISEEGDQAPTQLALARLAYAVGDRDTYAAAVYWWSRELVAQVVKEGALTKWREQWMPWNYPGVDPPTVTGSNLWGTNASWVDSGFGIKGRDDGQWAQFPTRLDDPDTLRFLSAYGTELSRRVVAAASPSDFKNNYAVFYDRADILGQDLSASQADYVGGDPKAHPPDNYVNLVAAAWREFPPKMETLIPATAPAITDATGFAWDQMNYATYGLVSQAQMPGGKLPTPQWYWWHSPAAAPGVDWGDHWTFGTLGPPDLVPSAISSQNLNAVSTLYGFALRPVTALDRLPPAIRTLADKANLPPARQTEVADAWDAQATVPVLAAGPFAHPGGTDTSLAHAPERAYLAGTLAPGDTYADTAAPAGAAYPKEAYKPGGTVSWQKQALNASALDFLAVYPPFKDKTNMAAYVALWVKSPQAIPAEFATGSDDGIKLWLNGKTIYDHPGARGDDMDQDHVPANLYAGWNSVLVKVTQGNGGWSLHFRVATPDGLPIPGLEFSDAPH